ncbi:MAG: sigma-70 family RNA polymerase sigma factor [Planctomycetaceae bacterium]
MNPERLAELLDRHAGALALYAARWTAAPDDVVQEAFVRLVGADPPPDRPVAWLYRVVRNLALSARRSDSRRRRREAVTARLEIDTADGWTAAEVGDALEQLDDDTREIVVAHVWGGLSFAEIAELAELSASAAHRRYQAGLATLRTALDQPCTNRTI